jgi:hypothetical protein
MPISWRNEHCRGKQYQSWICRDGWTSVELVYKGFACSTVAFVDDWGSIGKNWQILAGG